MCLLWESSKLQTLWGEAKIKISLNLQINFTYSVRVQSIICSETCQIMVNCIMKKTPNIFLRQLGTQFSHITPGHEKPVRTSALEQHSSRGSSAQGWCYDVHVGGETPGAVQCLSISCKVRRFRWTFGTRRALFWLPENPCLELLLSLLLGTDLIMWLPQLGQLSYARFSNQAGFPPVLQITCRVFENQKVLQSAQEHGLMVDLAVLRAVGGLDEFRCLFHPEQLCDSIL